MIVLIHPFFQLHSTFILKRTIGIPNILKNYLFSTVDHDSLFLCDFLRNICNNGLLRALKYPITVVINSTMEY